MLVAPLILAGCCLSASPEGSSEWTVETLAKAMQARDRALKSYSLDAKFQVRKKSDFTGALLDSSTSEQIEVERASHRYWVHRLGEVYIPASGKVGRKQESFILKDDFIAFDGERTKLASRSPGLDSKTGKESKVLIKTGMVIHGSQPFWTIDPGEFVGLFGGLSIGDRLMKDAFLIVPSTAPGVVAVECDYGVHAGDKTETRWKSRFEIAVSKNLAVVRKEAFVKHRGSSRWVPYLTATAGDWVEVDGFWLPGTYHQVHENIRADEPPQLVTDTLATLTHWSVNPKIADDRFRVAFESGTLVSDSERGTTYRVGKITDRKIAEDARVATALRARFDTGLVDLPPRPLPLPERRRRWLGPALALAGLAAVVVVVALWRKSWSWRRAAGEGTS